MSTINTRWHSTKTNYRKKTQTGIASIFFCMPTFLLNPVSELYTCFSWLPICLATNLELYHITSNLLPLSPRSDQDSKLTSLFQLVNNSTGRLVNFPRLWFDVILDFARVTNVLHYITLHEWSDFIIFVKSFWSLLLFYYFCPTARSSCRHFNY